MKGWIPGKAMTPLDAYPVGSIYLSTVATSPAEIFGGTWARIKDRFLLAAGDTYAAGSTGGEAAVALTEDNNGQHRHDIMGAGNIYYAMGEQHVWINQPAEDTSYTNQTTASGSGTPHNNMPPYLSVHVWQRTG